MTFPCLPPSEVEVPEITFQDHVDLPPADTALVIVGMQNDFVSEGGSLVVPAAAETVPRIQELLESARSAGVRVAFTQDTHLEGDSEWEIWPAHVHEGSWGWGIIDKLRPREQELVCRKSRYDAFYDTSLDHYLSRAWKVQHLVIVGTVSNICVLHTAASAGLRWFHIVVPADAISALTPFDQASTLRQVSTLYNGDVVRSTADVRFQE